MVITFKTTFFLIKKINSVCNIPHLVKKNAEHKLATHFKSRRACNVESFLIIVSCFGYFIMSSISKGKFHLYHHVISAFCRLVSKGFRKNCCRTDKNWNRFSFFVRKL